MTQPFFLTRQTANLMEDFVRELEASSTLFLLYGDTGIGKTALLQELCDKRLGASRVHWIDLRAGGEEIGEKVDRSAEIEQIFEQAENGDIIVADHFENGLQKTRHQLFLSWTTDGVDKQLNLIIASDNQGFNEFRQLAKQYQVGVQSFQHMPLSSEEIDAFIGFHLFPEHPIGKLEMPSELRRQFQGSGGIIARVIEIADHDGSKIRISPLADSETERKGSWVLVSVVSVVALAIGIGWYLFSRPQPMLSAPTGIETAAVETQQAQPEPETVESPVMAMPEPESTPETGELSADEMAAEPEDTAESSAEPDAELDSAAAMPAETVAEAEQSEVSPVTDETGESGESVTESESVATMTSEPEQADEVADDGDGIVVESEPGTALDSDVVLEAPVTQSETQETVVEAEVAKTEVAMVIPTGDLNSRFANELKKSLDWIFAREDVVGTVQILLLSYENFDAAVYFDYVDNLAARGVDTDSVRIFKTVIGGRVVYSVFHGEYASRQAAYAAIPDLPQVLRDVEPIPRSVGGIRQEIRRLEAQN